MKQRVASPESVPIHIKMNEYRSSGNSSVISILSYNGCHLLKREFSPPGANSFL